VRFDHLMHWVPDLDAAVAAYRALGFPVNPGGEHPHRGTHNAAWRCGVTYIELIAVHDWDVFRRARPTTAEQIEIVLQSGGGGLRFAVQTDDVTAAVAAARAAGCEVADPSPGSIRRRDGSTASWSTAALAGPPWAPFFIQYQGRPDSSERLARLRAQGSADSPWPIERLTVETADPAAAADLLTRALATAVPSPSPAGLVVQLDGCAVVLRPGPRERVVLVALGGTDAPAGEVAGLRYARATAE
jgi:catechol 2,3-dioxygenase-like lactoylglutathione lyase family enzyme